jgi:hypothetical protein
VKAPAATIVLAVVALAAGKTLLDAAVDAIFDLL